MVFVLQMQLLTFFFFLGVECNILLELLIEQYNIKFSIILVFLKREVFDLILYFSFYEECTFFGARYFHVCISRVDFFFPFGRLSMKMKKSSIRQLKRVSFLFVCLFVANFFAII